MEEAFEGEIMFTWLITFDTLDIKEIYRAKCLRNTINEALEYAQQTFPKLVVIEIKRIS